MMVLFVVACTEVPIEELPKVEIAENPDHAIIRGLGLSTDGIVEHEDSYVVEEDIVVSKEYVEELKDMPQTRQAYYYRHIANDKFKNIRVYIDPAIGTDWTTATIDALSAWNNLPNCEIGFTTVTSGAYDVIIRRNSAAGIAWADLPRNNAPGAYVEIGNDFNNRPRSVKTYVMVHELGHTLRFMHSNYKTNNADADRRSETNDIAGTPDAEYASVMYSHSGGRVWSSSSFTAGDIAAAQALYGIPIWSRTITGPSQCQTTSSPTFTLNLGTHLINLNVLWYVNGIQKQSGTSFSYTPTSLPSGQVTVKAVVAYDGTNYEASKTVTVTLPPPPTTAPTITRVTWRSDGGVGPGGAPIPVTPGNYAYFTAEGDLTGATLEWTKDIGCDPYGGFTVSQYTYAALYDGSDPYYIRVSVRAQRDGKWSNTVYATAQAHNPYYRAPAPNAKDGEETDGGEETEAWKNPGIYEISPYSPLPVQGLELTIEQ